MKHPQSLKKTKDFQKVYKKGRSCANQQLVMYVLPNNMTYNRLGISISKKIGNSVKRHHLARLIRENMRLSEEMLNSGFDIVVIARHSAASVSYHELDAALLHLAKLHHILMDEENSK